jgi:hypothetical protein
MSQQTPSQPGGRPTAKGKLKVELKDPKGQAKPEIVEVDVEIQPTGKLPSRLMRAPTTW